MVFLFKLILSILFFSPFIYIGERIITSSPALNFSLSILHLIKKLSYFLNKSLSGSIPYILLKKASDIKGSTSIFFKFELCLVKYTFLKSAGNNLSKSFNISLLLISSYQK